MVVNIICYTGAISSFCAGSNAAAAEYCEGSIFSARCIGADEVVVMETALFGRIRTSARCITVRPETTCQVNVRDQFDGWCSGQRSCDVRVSHIVDLLQNSMRCLQESRGYLEASYTCVRGRRENTTQERIII